MIIILFIGIEHILMFNSNVEPSPEPFAGLQKDRHIVLIVL